MELLSKIEQFAVELEKFIDDKITGLNGRVGRAERSLLRYLLTDLLPKLEQSNGRLTRTARNIARAQLIEQIMNTLGRSEIDNDLRVFAAELLDVAGRNEEYYLTIGINEAKVKAVSEGVSLIRAKIGLDAEGALLKDGYLYRLGQSDLVRQKLKDYVLNSMASKQDYAAFAKGLEQLVTGTKDVDGVLRSYWRQYAYDTYNQVREVNNTQYADELGLEWFVYTGGIIKTSRAFCIKRNGRVYNRNETTKWKNDPDLIDQRTKESYNPLIERGRYNCRHFIMWVDEETAQRIKAQQ